jgi:hypothetical protein
MAAGRPDEPCWCMQVTIPDALIASLPEEARGVACFCAACVAAANVSTPVSDTVSDT